MRLIALFLVACSAFAAVNGSSVLAVTVTVQATTLTGSMTAGASTFTVADATPFTDTPPYNVLIGPPTGGTQEIVQVCTTGATMTVCASGRGQQNTTASPHASGAMVSIIRQRQLPAAAVASELAWLPSKTTVINGTTTALDAAQGILQMIREYFQQTILPQNPGGQLATDQAAVAAAQATLAADLAAAIP